MKANDLLVQAESALATITGHSDGAFTAGDGAPVVIAIQNEREWANFCAYFLCNRF